MSLSFFYFILFYFHFYFFLELQLLRRSRCLVLKICIAAVERNLLRVMQALCPGLARVRPFLLVSV